MTYYYTADAQDLSIEQDARIYPAASLGEVRAALTGDADLDDPNDNLVLVDGQFGDCWIKAHRGAKISDDIDIAPFADEQIIISPPGANPGNSAYWITPTEQVIVAVPRSLAQEWQLKILA